MQTIKKQRYPLLFDLGRFSNVSILFPLHGHTMSCELSLKDRGRVSKGDVVHMTLLQKKLSCTFTRLFNFFEFKFLCSLGGIC